MNDYTIVAASLVGGLWAGWSDPRALYGGDTGNAIQVPPPALVRPVLDCAYCGFVTFLSASVTKCQHCGAPPRGVR